MMVVKRQSGELQQQSGSKRKLAIESTNKQVGILILKITNLAMQTEMTKAIAEENQMKNTIQEIHSWLDPSSSPKQQGKAQQNEDKKKKAGITAIKHNSKKILFNKVMIGVA